ncbi:MAG: hypothetical protein AB1482_06210 [Pseudomonadota bacterium]
MNWKQTFAAALAGAALAGMAGCETAAVRGDVRVHDRDLDVRVVFTDSDRRILREYYRVDYRALPPGLAKQGKLPPGHAYRLRVRQPIPPEVRWSPLPLDLDRQLSRLPDGYVRIVVGGSVAIMHVHTRVIVDLIEDLDD